MGTGGAGGLVAAQRDRPEPARRLSASTAAAEAIGTGERSDLGSLGDQLGGSGAPPMKPEPPVNGCTGEKKQPRVVVDDRRLARVFGRIGAGGDLAQVGDRRRHRLRDRLGLVVGDRPWPS